ncbi:MAG: type IX secretion system membrane protein PorP/SprF [Lewinellaceae bacterium]|nr:type IX secretion system membrane protein PorP/SprF [Lewinellaceae bacterium]
MKQFSKPILSLILLLMVVGQTSAQDPRFSQYYASPWNLNPAMTGLFNGRWRVTANYREPMEQFSGAGAVPDLFGRVRRAF